MKFYQYVEIHGPPADGTFFKLKGEYDPEPRIFCIGDLDSSGHTSGCGCCADSYTYAEVIAVAPPQKLKWRKPR